MIIYYSRTGNATVFAQGLHEMTDEKTFYLEEVKKTSGPFLIFQCLTKTGGKLVSMPEIPENEPITLCSPVYAGGFPPAVMFFLKNANLKGRKIKVVLTCSVGNSETVAKYTKFVNETFDKYGCKLSKILIQHMKVYPKPEMWEVKEKLENFVKGE